MERVWHGLLTQLVNEAIDCGHLRRDLDVEQFIWELSGIYLSHHAAHRFLRATDADRRAETALQALIERALPHTSRRKPKRRAKRKSH
jgi:hypothetical protein